MTLLDNLIIISSKKKNTIGKKVNRNSVYYQTFMKNTAELIRKEISTSELIVRPSVGQGNYAEIPWICILSNNPSISPSPQKGIYVVLLFNKDGNSFYLSLSQGITNFINLYTKKKDRDIAIKSSVEYFRSEIPDKLLKDYSFSTQTINLGESVGQLAKGYISTTIISKKYEVNNFDEIDFLESLQALVIEYQDIITYIGTKTYNEVLELINPKENFESVDQAIEDINNTLKDTYITSRGVIQKPIKVEQGKLKPEKYGRLTQKRINKKIDHLKVSKERYQTGLKGEELALEIERDRLINLGLEPNLYIKWCSTESDSYGYDIESVDYKNGSLEKIFIEVKATKDIRDNPFFISKNELETSNQKADKYRVLRIYDIRSVTPKYYFADGNIEENFYIDPVTYSARYKYDVHESS